MPCTHVKLPGGGGAIVCTGRGRRPRCFGCGKPADLLCDWKVPDGTCDRPLCKACTYEPAPDKDLCPQHAAEWKARSRA